MSPIYCQSENKLKMMHILQSWTVLLRTERLKPFSPAPCTGTHAFSLHQGPADHIRTQLSTSYWPLGASGFCHFSLEANLPTCFCVPDSLGMLHLYSRIKAGRLGGGEVVQAILAELSLKI